MRSLLYVMFGLERSTWLLVWKYCHSIRWKDCRKLENSGAARDSNSCFQTYCNPSFHCDESVDFRLIEINRKLQFSFKIWITFLNNSVNCQNFHLRYYFQTVNKNCLPFDTYCRFCNGWRSNYTIIDRLVGRFTIQDYRALCKTVEGGQSL